MFVSIKLGSILVLALIFVLVIFLTPPPVSFDQATSLQLLSFFLPLTLLLTYLLYFILKNIFKTFLLSLILDLILILNSQSRLNILTLGLVIILTLLIVFFPKNFSFKKTRRLKPIPPIHRIKGLN